MIRLPLALKLVPMLAITALLLLIDACWISAKAVVAQRLIAYSWGQDAARPWPWADTHPVARLTISGESLYVLAGSQGASLAFGPGHVDGTALPGEPGVSVLGGHRDTHFAVLQSAVPGDRILVQDRSRHWSEYAIVLMQVEDVRQSPYLSLPADEHLLVLVTCYPFDAVQPGGPLRFVVYAVREAGL